MTLLRAGLFILLLAACAFAQRIKIEGAKFMVGGNPIFMLGANTPWHKWNEFGNGSDSNWWNGHFKTLHDSGINCTRVWVSCNGQNASPGINASGQVQPPTDQFWTEVGSLFDAAKNNRIYLMIALISFDHSKPGNPNADRWKLMYGSAENRQSFADNYAVPFVKKFGGNPYFWSIDVGNELDWVFENQGVAKSDMFDLAARVSLGVHANSEVLVTLGTGAGPKYMSPVFGTNAYSDAELGKLQAGGHLDFYDDHYYPWMRQYFSSAFEKGPADWKISEKPCVVGEYPAIGDSGFFKPDQCLQKAAALGWLGVMPWTSNGVDANGSLADFGGAFKAWSAANANLVFPPAAGALALPHAAARARISVAYEGNMLRILGDGCLPMAAEILSLDGARIVARRSSSGNNGLALPLQSLAENMLVLRITDRENREIASLRLAR